MYEVLAVAMLLAGQGAAAHSPPDQQVAHADEAQGQQVTHQQVGHHEVHILTVRRRPALQARLATRESQLINFWKS